MGVKKTACFARTDETIKNILSGITVVSDEEAAERDRQILEIEAENLRKAREEMYQKSGIADKFAAVELSDLVETGIAEMKDGKGNVIADLRFLDDFISDIEDGKPRVLLVFGGYGTGKSVFASAVMHELCKRGISSAYYKSHEVMQRLDDVKWHCSRESRQGIINEICNPRFRVIDEIGRYPDSKNEQFVLFDIANKCYEAYKSLIYVSNLTKKEFGEFMGGAVIDRFKGFGMTIEFSGKSLRGTEEELYTK